MFLNQATCDNHVVCTVYEHCMQPHKYYTEKASEYELPLVHTFIPRSMAHYEMYLYYTVMNNHVYRKLFEDCLPGGWITSETTSPFDMILHLVQTWMGCRQQDDGVLYAKLCLHVIDLYTRARDGLSGKRGGMWRCLDVCTLVGCCLNIVLDRLCGEHWTMGDLAKYLLTTEEKMKGFWDMIMGLEWKFLESETEVMVELEPYMYDSPYIHMENKWITVPSVMLGKEFVHCILNEQVKQGFLFKHLQENGEMTLVSRDGVVCKTLSNLEYKSIMELPGREMEARIGFFLNNGEKTNRKCMLISSDKLSLKMYVLVNNLF